MHRSGAGAPGAHQDLVHGPLRQAATGEIIALRSTAGAEQGTVDTGGFDVLGYGIRRGEVNTLGPIAVALQMEAQRRLWDLKQIFDLAVSEGNAVRNPATLLFTPKSAKKPNRLVMTIQEVQLCFAVLDQRERLIAKLAITGGIRPGEIFALKWGQVTETYAEIQQRVYRGVVDTPKTDNSFS